MSTHVQYCDLCDSPFIHTHRLIPGNWGGAYELNNVINLCPNHHAAIHLLMRWFYRGGKVQNQKEEEQLIYCFADRELQEFWADTVKPIVIARMVAEGRWHPYVRTLPPKAPRKKKSVKKK